MCLIGVAVGVHPDVSCLVLHNRDEEYSRPTTELTVDRESGIMCSRDERSGGTWMGLNTARGHFASLVNFRSRFWLTPFVKKTRGFIVSQFLTEGGPPSLTSSDNFLSEPKYTTHRYSGFSMVYSNLFRDSKEGAPRVYVVSNRPSMLVSGAYGRADSIEHDHAEGKDAESRITDYHLYKTELRPGKCYASSNSFFGDYSWPKVDFMQKTLEQAMADLPTGQQDEVELAQECVRRVVASLMRVVPFELAEEVLETSPDKRKHEIAFQSVFVSRGDQGGEVNNSWCTRQQTITLRTKNYVHYFYRDMRGSPSGDGAWDHVVVAVPGADGDTAQQSNSNVVSREVFRLLDSSARAWASSSSFYAGKGLTATKALATLAVGGLLLLTLLLGRRRG
jgi:uncharacterized protein with NRDE domain